MAYSGLPAENALNPLDGFVPLGYRPSRAAAPPRLVARSDRVIVVVSGWINGGSP